VTVYKCDGEHKDWSPEEQACDFALVLVRSGAFRRRIDGIETLAEPLVAYLERPGSVYQVAHPRGGDICTAIGLSETTIDSIIDPSQVPSGSLLHIKPAEDLAHRLLLMRLRGRAEQDELLERTFALAGGLLRKQALQPDVCSVPTSLRRIADQVREALSDQPNLNLQELADLLGLSIYYVSRAFRSATGLTVSQYRLSVRAKLAMDRMESGESNLAALAIECGFSDQPHMTRTLRRETELTPFRLLKTLARKATDGPN